MYPQIISEDSVLLTQPSVLSSSLFPTNSLIASRSVEFEMEKVFHAMEMGDFSFCINC